MIRINIMIIKINIIIKSNCTNIYIINITNSIKIIKVISIVINNIVFKIDLILKKIRIMPTI